MSYTKTIVCLANSRKPPSGRCVAGREVLQDGFGDWIRPVSARPTREVSDEERRYEDGTEPMILDVIDIQMAKPEPEDHQYENHVIDAEFRWVCQGQVTWQNLQAAVEHSTGPLWLNGHSSSHGLNDRVPEDQLGSFARSLYLVQPEKLVIIVGREDSPFGPARRRVRAQFHLAKDDYCVAITDPVVEREYLERGDGRTELDGALLCVSLGEVFHGFAYKLAAAVIIPQRANG